MRGDGEGCGVSVNDYRYAHGAQINFGGLTPYLPMPGSNEVFLVHVHVSVQCAYRLIEYTLTPSVIMWLFNTVLHDLEDHTFYFRCNRRNVEVIHIWE